MPGFTSRYNMSKLSMRRDTMHRGHSAGKENKAGSRQKKIDLINGSNPEWRDLYDDL